MKDNTAKHRSSAKIRRFTLLAIPVCLLPSCAIVEHPLTRHDMDGDGAISHSEYQQNHMQYNMASRQRADEYRRARLATDHVANAGDFVSQADRVINLLGNFGR